MTGYFLGIFSPSLRPSLLISRPVRPACESDSPFESPNFGDSENEDSAAVAKKGAASTDGSVAGISHRPAESAPAPAAAGETEKSAGSVRQRLKEETEKESAPAVFVGSGGERRTPRISRSRKSSERHLSTTTLTSSSEEKRDNAEDENDDECGDCDGGAPVGEAVVQELVKKIQEQAEVIQAREANAFDLSKMNAELTETVTSLR